ncbi:Signal transduction histidine kinase [Clostridium amylolyticum]|uniref:histidine kinase n=1 Tax=Clostridium amylolyticum TaxID=1121298 RepID=A0A1M6N364_9CLOT|nr:sensor histidine kinase [Clostridium amylolyticum]SHJ90102.1 Signal transduction histidine kinase [Clostridium amylolyticum]
MKKTETLKLLMIYFKMQLKVIILLGLFWVTFAFVFFLYNLSVEPVVYAIVLSASMGTVFFIVDFIKLYKKHSLLLDLKSSITLGFDKLPETEGIIEEDYRDLLISVYKKSTETAYAAEISRSNLVDYYTLWAHQIKTPIAAMRLVLQSEESEQNAELSMELFKIEQYVEFVLQYLRVESMSSDLLLKKYSLDDIVKQAVRKYARMFIRKKIKLNFKELNCEVLTDEKWLVFVIEQLLSNALKYTKEGTISIYMDSCSEKTLIIEDTGIGIREEDLTRLAERGFTGYNGRSDKKSTGLGLYLCKQILNRLSHSIAIDSKVDKGTKVMIDLKTIEVGVE